MPNYIFIIFYIFFTIICKIIINYTLNFLSFLNFATNPFPSFCRIFASPLNTVFNKKKVNITY